MTVVVGKDRIAPLKEKRYLVPSLEGQLEMPSLESAFSVSPSVSDARSNLTRFCQDFARRWMNHLLDDQARQEHPSDQVVRQVGRRCDTQWYLIHRQEVVAQNDVLLPEHTIGEPSAGREQVVRRKHQACVLRPEPSRIAGYGQPSGHRRSQR